MYVFILQQLRPVWIYSLPSKYWVSDSLCTYSTALPYVAQGYSYLCIHTFWILTWLRYSHYFVSSCEIWDFVRDIASEFSAGSSLYHHSLILINFIAVAGEVWQIFSVLAGWSVSGEIEIHSRILMPLPTPPHVRGGKLHEYRFMTAFSLNVCVSGVHVFVCVVCMHVCMNVWLFLHLSLSTRFYWILLHA